MVKMINRTILIESGYGEEAELPTRFLQGYAGDEFLSKFLAEMIRSAKIEGLNAEKGLGCFGWDGKTYMDSLRAYVVHTPPLIEAARMVGASPEYTLADYAAIVHRIKRVSYAISAEGIGHMAERLEHAAIAGKVDFIEHTNHWFIAAAEEFIVELEDLLDSMEKQRQKHSRTAPDSAALETILDAAGNNDMGVMDNVVKKLEQYCYQFEADLLPWIKEQIEKGEFGEIKEWLTPQETVLFVEA
jgi:HPt (histidine-containing phosphotransfer) domain-containing protein